MRRYGGPQAGCLGLKDFGDLCAAVALIFEEIQVHGLLVAVEDQAVEEKFTFIDDVIEAPGLKIHSQRLESLARDKEELLVDEA